MERMSDLYRFYDRNGVLLYVGRSLNAASRAISHKTKPWWPDVANMTVEHVPSTEIAAAECQAIKEESPIHNLASNSPAKPAKLHVPHPKQAEYTRRSRDKVRGGPPRTPLPCGTRSAATRHRRNGEPVCDECVAAEREYQRNRHEARKTA